MGGNLSKDANRGLLASITVIAMLSLLVLRTFTGPATAGLKLHPENPRYFQDTETGTPVMITSYGTVSPSSNASDYLLDARRHTSNGMFWIRLWHMLPWEGLQPEWPWARSSTDGAYMGGAKFDLNTWNPEYWFRLRDCLEQASNTGTQVEVMIFDRCSVSPAGSDRWGSNPWASDNNVNQLELPGGSGEGIPDFYYFRTKPNLRYQQERYIRKMVDETITYPNVVYEVENEHRGLSNPDWVSYYAQFLRSYIAQRYPTEKRLVSYSSLEADLEMCYWNPNIDIVNKHFGAELETDPSIANRYLETRWRFGKAMNIDEFANGVTDYGLLRQECWTIVTSGGNFHIEDAEQNACPYDVVASIEAFKTESGWDFVHAAPNRGLVASGDGYCMAKPSSEYVCYFPTGGDKLLSLPYGNYTARWWNPREGLFVSETEFSHQGGIKSVTTPDSTDWVVQIKYTAQSPYPDLPWIPIYPPIPVPIPTPIPWIPVIPPSPVPPPIPWIPIYPPSPINPVPPVYPVLF